VVNIYRGPNSKGEGVGFVGWRCLNWTFWATAAYQVQDRAIFRKYEKGWPWIMCLVFFILDFGPFFFFPSSSLVPLPGVFPLFIYLSRNSSEQSTCTQQTRVYIISLIIIIIPPASSSFPRFPPRFVWIVESSQEQPKYEFLQILRIFIINLP